MRKFETTFGITVTLGDNAPDGLNLEAWAEWTAYRRKTKLKKYKTDRTARMLAQLSFDKQMECVNSSINQEYQGLFVNNFIEKPVREIKIHAQRSGYVPDKTERASDDVVAEQLSQIRMLRRPGRMT